MKNEEGQAVVEYILMLLLAVSFVAILGAGFKSTVRSLWMTFTHDIVSACPKDCPPPPPFPGGS